MVDPSSIWDRTLVPVVQRDAVVGVVGRNPAVASVVETLFRSVAAKAVDPATLVPRWAEYLQAWARRFQNDLGDATVRVGEVLKDGPEQMVPVRGFGGTKDWSGWVLLLREKERYLVGDVQIVADPKTGLLDPESPDQLISSPSRR